MHVISVCHVIPSGQRLLSRPRGACSCPAVVLGCASEPHAFFHIRFILSCCCPPALLASMVSSSCFVVMAVLLLSLAMGEEW